MQTRSQVGEGPLRRQSRRCNLGDRRQDFYASYPFLFKGMFLTSLPKAFIRICFYHLSISYQSNLQPLGRKSHDCKHVFETCYVLWMQVDASVCLWMHTHTY